VRMAFTLNCLVKTPFSAKFLISLGCIVTSKKSYVSQCARWAASICGLMVIVLCPSIVLIIDKVGLCWCPAFLGYYPSNFHFIKGHSANFKRALILNRHPHSLQRSNAGIGIPNTLPVWLGHCLHTFILCLYCSLLLSNRCRISNPYNI